MTVPPTRVAVALLDRTSLFELAVPCAVFTEPEYELLLCATAAGDPGHRGPGGLTLRAEHGLEALTAAGLVVVPACVMDGYEPPADLLDALRTAHRNGARIASLCSGAFVLAAAGLLDGREAATHWMYADELRRRHPRVTVNDQALYVDDGDILTSAGTAAAIDLCLHIVRGDHGTARAAETGRRLVVAPHREGGQRQYVPPRRPLPARADTGLGPVLDWALARLDQPLAIAELARRAGMSERTFGRHFAREVGTTPLKWLIQQRLSRARELLETTDLPVDAVAERSGLGTGDGLRQHFARALGTTPAAYRRAFRAAA
ncbi:GlxA family transcriptional regulator [Streptomyces litchfieldiae]|uniref:Helix-turn-helix domain-containing protein n=1 Tax=Streptomyces litchfieldiae TaxID=3075543 RepID=A0ABU2MX69_9ACTN|nr:helix-turn-helix domain-containing protein [Streptomyces sp. DSM 44938]MDT0345428.1 helix-turn-helix domain-containing protein [Streptomyces sp. DSM 44938]